MSQVYLRISKLLSWYYTLETNIGCVYEYFIDINKLKLINNLTESVYFIFE